MIKILFLVLMLIYSLFGIAQNKVDTSYRFSKRVGDHLTGNSRTCHIYMSDTLREDMILQWSDGEIEIRGDTINSIRSLLKFIQAKQKHEDDLWELIRRGVEFSNTVSNEYKNSDNKTWVKYQAALKKRGFITTRKK